MGFEKRSEPQFAVRSASVGMCRSSFSKTRAVIASRWVLLVVALEAHRGKPLSCFVCAYTADFLDVLRRGVLAGGDDFALRSRR